MNHVPRRQKKFKAASIVRRRLRAFRIFGGLRWLQMFRGFCLFRCRRPFRALRVVWPVRSAGVFRPALTLRSVEPLRSLRRFGAIQPVAARLKLAQGAQQRFDFALVSELLALGEFDQFQNFLHLLQRLPQRFHDLHHLIDGLADGRTVRPGHARSVFGGLKSGARWNERPCRNHRRVDGGRFNGRRGRFYLRRRFRGNCGLTCGRRFGFADDSRRPQAATAATTAAMTAPTLAAARVFWRWGRPGFR